MAELPIPRTTTEELLLALTLEVQGLHADLKGARDGEPAPADGSTVLSEPKARPARQASSRTRARGDGS